MAPNSDSLAEALGQLGLTLDVHERGAVLEGGVRVDLLGRLGDRPLLVLECGGPAEETLREALDLLVAVRRDRELLARLLGTAPGREPRVLLVVEPGRAGLLERLTFLPLEVFEWRGLRGSLGLRRLLVPVESGSGQEASSTSPAAPIPAPPAADPHPVLDALEELWSRRVERVDPALLPREHPEGLEGRLGDRRLYLLRREPGGVCVEVDGTSFSFTDPDPERLRRDLEPCLTRLLEVYLVHAPAAEPGTVEACDLETLLRAARAAEPAPPAVLQQVVLRPGEGPLLTREEYDSLRG